MNKFALAGEIFYIGIAATDIAGELKQTNI